MSPRSPASHSTAIRCQERVRTVEEVWLRRDCLEYPPDFSVCVTHHAINRQEQVAVSAIGYEWLFDMLGRANVGKKSSVSSAVVHGAVCYACSCRIGYCNQARNRRLCERTLHGLRDSV